MAKQKTYKRKHAGKAKETKKLKSSNSKSIAKNTSGFSFTIPSNLTNVLSYSWFWIVGIVTIIMVYFMSAVPGNSLGYFSNVFIEYDSSVTVQDVEAELESYSMAILDYEQPSSNKVTLWTEASNEKLVEFRNDYSEKAEIVNFTAGQQIPVNQIEKYTIPVLGTFAIGLVISAISIFILSNKKGFTEKMKIWVSYNLVPILVTLSLLTLGILVSYTGLIRFTPTTFSLLSVLISAIVLVNTYLLVLNPEGKYQELLFFRD